MLGTHNRNVKVGDKVRVLDSSYTAYQTGELVTVIELLPYGVLAHNGEYPQRLDNSDFELIDNEQDSLHLIANLSAEVVRLSKRVDALVNFGEEISSQVEKLKAEDRVPIKISVQLGDDTPYNFTVFRNE